MSLLNFQDKPPDTSFPPAAIMFTDIVGYTALIGDGEQKPKIEAVLKKMAPLETEQ